MVMCNRCDEDAEWYIEQLFPGSPGLMLCSDCVKEEVDGGRQRASQ